MRLAFFLVAVLCSTSTPGLYAQQIRKWQDNGRTIYSDIRPSPTAREIGNVSGAGNEVRVRPVDPEKPSSTVAPSGLAPNAQPGPAASAATSAEALRKSLESLREIQNKAEERRRIID
jgi:hypothetical protein